jgi:uncharacterized protein (TIGR02145 family)
MKKLYATIFLIGLGIFAQLSAQTLKNIHRHNLPVLQIPIDLIDKVETVDVGGIKTLKISKLFGDAIQIPVTVIDSITHYIGSIEPEQLGEMRTASVMGVVRDANNVPVTMAIVRSPFGGEETRTDANGVFFLNNIAVYDKLGYITINKPGYHKGSRSFLPLDEGSNRVNIQLLPLTQSGSFNATIGGTITSGLLQLNFSANAIQHNGQPYTGTVRVFAQALDPSSQEMFDQMPGELLGGMNDSLRMLRSFGMASIELRDANMNELQLAEGSSTTLTFTIPDSLLADAPETIDWWSFDEGLGYWKLEGLAQKLGSQYIGSASHFTWWNCDVPENFNEFHGTVNTVGGVPISDALVNVVTPTMGTGSGYTNAEGEFSGRVPKNQLLNLNIYLTCEATNNWTLAYAQTIISESEPISGSYIAELNNHFPITGTVVNCQGQPVESGYLTTGQQVYITNNGVFNLLVCETGLYSIRGFNSTNADSITVSEIVSALVEIDGVEVGILHACLGIYGNATDIDGNLYPTVVIGTQMWMAESMRTTRFANGTLIPNIIDDSEWLMQVTPMACSQNNIPANDEIYGKLYNWHTVADPSNVCPAGWHVPSNEEFNQLISFLGGDSIAGGKMKSVSGWDYINAPNSNESGFSSIPSGYRFPGNGIFYGIGNSCHIWCSDNYGAVDAMFRNITNEMNNVGLTVQSKQYGLSVRCLKD